MKTLMIAEYDEHGLKPITYHAIKAATELKTELDVWLIGPLSDRAVREATQIAEISRVFVTDDSMYAHALSENISALIAEKAKMYDYLVAASSTFSKNCFPRVAALLDVSMISDVIRILSPDTFERPMYAGNVIATVQSIDKIKVMTFRATAFDRVQLLDKPHCSFEKINEVIENTQSQFVEHTLTQSSRPELTSARVIISGGRGLKSADNFKKLESIADKLGAAIGASRAAVDAGFAPNDYQVGQTGKVVAPDLYIAVGISGAIQHLAGMKDSKVIVAINQDPDAPIFQIADYGLVEDLFTVLPALEEALDVKK